MVVQVLDVCSCLRNVFIFVCVVMCVCVGGRVECECVHEVEGRQGQSEEACGRRRRAFYNERPSFPFYGQGYQVISESS